MTVILYIIVAILNYSRVPMKGCTIIYTVVVLFELAYCTYSKVGTGTDMGIAVQYSRLS
jgi:hypothetical protein